MIESHRHSKLIHLQSVYPNLAADKLARLFPLYQTDDVDLVVNWQSEDGTSLGQTFVVGLHMGSQQAAWVPSAKWKGRRTYLEASEREKQSLISGFLKNRHIREECPIRAIMTADELVLKPLSDAELDVAFQIINSSWSKSFHLRLELLNPGDDDAYVLFTSHNDIDTICREPRFSWLGQGSMEIHVAPGESCGLSCRAMFSAEGIYDLSRWRLTASIISDQNAEVYTITPSANFLVRVIRGADGLLQ